MQLNTDILYCIFYYLGHRLTVRTLLWIKYSDNFYYRGYIDGVDNKIYVRFYEHDDRCSFPLNDHSGMVRDVTPKEVMVTLFYIYLRARILFKICHLKQ